MSTSSSLPSKVSFVLSLAVLMFLYGFMTRWHEWFPNQYLEAASAQATALQKQWTGATIDLYPRVYDRSGVRVTTPSAVQPGLTLLTSAWKSSSEDWHVGLKLIDMKGDPVHEWVFNQSEVFDAPPLQRRNPEETDIHGSLLLPNGDIVVNLEYVGMARLNSCGKVLWTLPEGNHHSIAQADDGTFWVPAVSPTPRASTSAYPDGFPGLNGKKVWLDRILRVSPEGTILQEINVLDVLYQNGLERYIPKTLGGVRPTPDKITRDVTHLNDVEPLSRALASEYPTFSAGDLVVSLRSLSLVFVFDPDTQTVKWHSSDPFIYQHDPDFLGDGVIGTFDNNYDLTERGQMLGGSRIVRSTPADGSTKTTFPTEQSEPLYTHVRGKWQQLEHGGALLTEASAGRVVEVDSSGKSVWEWIHPGAGTAKVPSVTKATRLDLTRRDVASWKCASPHTSN